MAKEYPCTLIKIMMLNIRWATESSKNWAKGSQLYKWNVSEGAKTFPVFQRQHLHQQRVKDYFIMTEWFLINCRAASDTLLKTRKENHSMNWIFSGTEGAYFLLESHMNIFSSISFNFKRHAGLRNTSFNLEIFHSSFTSLFLT